MRTLPATVLFCLLGAGAAAQQDTPSPTPAGPPRPAPDEVVVFSGVNYKGDWMVLKVGDEVPELSKSAAGNWDRRIDSLMVGAQAIAVLFSSPKFEMFCLGLPANPQGGPGYYPDLSRVTHKNLPLPLGGRVRSIRVVSLHADPITLCRPGRRK